MSDCIPEMKKDRLYKVFLLLGSISVGNMVAQLEKLHMLLVSMLEHFAMHWKNIPV